MTSQWRPRDYFAANPVFRVEAFATAHREEAGAKSASTRATIHQHVRAGNLLRIRRGVYVVVPRGQTPEGLAVDPFAVASRLAPDAVVAYHGALELHGRAHSVSRRVQYLTCTRTRRFEFRGTEFVPVSLPPALRGLADAGGGIVDRPRGGVSVRVTTLERTLVDILDSPRHGGGWEEIWRSLESVEFFDLDAVIDYALKLGSAVTVARVGFYLEQHREALMVEDGHLERLSAHAPRKPAYLSRGRREPGKLLPRWNLVVPARVLNREWEEPA